MSTVLSNILSSMLLADHTVIVGESSGTCGACVREIFAPEDGFCEYPDCRTTWVCLLVRIIPPDGLEVLPALMAERFPNLKFIGLAGGRGIDSDGTLEIVKPYFHDGWRELKDISIPNASC